MNIEVKSSSTVQTSTLGKATCCVCGKEVNVLRRTQMADFNEICKPCDKKAGPFFDATMCSLPQYQAHFKQLEDSKKIFMACIKKNRKVKRFFGKEVWVDPVNALIAFYKKQGGFGPFGGTRYYMVYRLADLEHYENCAFKNASFLKRQNGVLSKAANAATGNPKAYFYFRGVEGVPYVQLDCSAGGFKELCKFIAKAMGTTGLRGIKTQFNKSASEGAAIGNMVNAVKNAAGAIDDQVTVEASARQAAESMDKLFYAGREEIMAKADAAIAMALK